MIRNALIAVYILVVLAISAVARAGVLPSNFQGEEQTAAELQNYNFKTHVGEIVALADGSLVLAMEDQQTFFVLKSQMDLTPYVGFKVMISGIELEHQLAPNFELETVDPLPGFGSGNKSVVFFVFGISEVR
ncbi:hypothetical protein QJS83_08255 [Bdellovibrio sp. 22V]|uniref:hypothetical protein n=1 Tax=Bdellovibrio TaxID=958 RepID=UPI002543D02C|nr:hypothetical protein [Bdellovibrio sp. 22V]WII73869.1 hypothetical protein QJS83_08255 [Bdellovibrio sp. 22V]